eukprot:421700-Amphidinium_carterae.3
MSCEFGRNDFRHSKFEGFQDAPGETCILMMLGQRKSQFANEGSKSCERSASASALQSREGGLLQHHMAEKESALKNELQAEAWCAHDSGLVLLTIMKCEVVQEAIKAEEQRLAQVKDRSPATTGTIGPSPSSLG